MCEGDLIGTKKGVMSHPSIASENVCLGPTRDVYVYGIYMQTYIYVCMCIYIYVSIYIYMNLYIYIYIYMNK